MNKYDFQPTRKPHQNFTYKAPEGMDNCSDLHVTNIIGGSVSVWKVKSIWERIKFLFSGEISLVIQGHGMPPVSLHTGDWHEIQAREREVENAEIK